MPKHDEAGRQIAGLLGYNPGPGIYSRLERAVQQMPANVRVEELPGLIKRYKEGVPGWELRATDLDSVIAGRDVVPRDELLARVQQTSPVYTHKEVVLAENPPTREIEQYDLESGKHVYAPMPVYQDEASRLGEGVAHGDPKYPGYGHGGSDYKELLLTQPGAGKHQYENHWTGAATNYTNANEDAVAHARFDTHGDALRINELQSDLGIYNRQMREAAGSSPTPQLPYQDDPEYIAQLEQGGWQVDYDDNGEFYVVGRKDPLEFPMEDSWLDVLIKRLALEAAKQGHRAIEVATPRAIRDGAPGKAGVGGDIENYEHFYGKVVPGALARLGRKMGGLHEDLSARFLANEVAPDLGRIREPVPPNYGSWANDMYSIEADSPRDEAMRILAAFEPPGPRPAAGPMLESRLETAFKWFSADVPPADMRERGELLQGMMEQNLLRNRPGLTAEEARAAVSQQMPQLARLAELHNEYKSTYGRLQDLGAERRRAALTQTRQSRPGRRYIMSDEMRRRLIQEGVGAAVAGGVLSQDDLINRLNQ
jgi:hypothetical protein